MSLILTSPGPEDLVRLLKAWRLWLLGALFGGVLGAVLYQITPAPYRARATVSVDFHLEQAWPQNTDREQFYYLERETRKLEEIAFSDAVLGRVSSGVPGVTVQEMRQGKLQLSQPGNGGWHFFADDSDPRKAAALASEWALAFVDEVQKQVSASGASGLEPFITVSGSQVDNLEAKRSLSESRFMAIGAAAIMAVSAFAVLFLRLDR